MFERQPAAGTSFPPLSRLHLDLAAVQLHDPVDDRQADAAAFGLGREVQIENPVELVGRNPDASVFDRQRDPAILVRLARPSSASRRSASPGSR